jgi:hypothetical protein
MNRTRRELVGGLEAAFRFVFCHLILEWIGSIHGQPFPPHMERVERRKAERWLELIVANKAIQLPRAAG